MMLDMAPKEATVFRDGIKMTIPVEEVVIGETKTWKFLDWFANIYTPIVVILSIIVFVNTRI